MRPSSTSARASGSSTSERTAPAATSSSAKKALPSERARMRSTAPLGTSPPTSAWTYSASSSRLKGGTSIRSRLGMRISSASSGRSGWRRCSSSDR